MLNASATTGARSDDAPRAARPNPGWSFEIAFAAAILLDSLLPARRFRMRMDAADVALLVCVVLSGGAVVRSAHALLAGWLRRRGAPWMSHALGVAAVATVAGVGMWHGPPHYALVTALIGGMVFVASVSWFAGPGRAPWRRVAGAVVVTAFFLVLLIGVDLNALSLFPRHVSVLCATTAVTWLMATLAIAPPLPAPAARRMLTVGAAMTGLCLALAPAASSRLAGHLRRQSELGTLLSPVSWAHALGPSTYLTWSNAVCPTVPQEPVTVTGQANGNNVLLLTIDTLRRDFYLGPGQTLASAYPNLASVVADGCRYDSVRSIGASTHISLPALYNGTLAWTAQKRPSLAAIADHAQMQGRVFGNLWEISGYTGLPAGEGEPTDSVTDRVIDEIRRADDQRQPWMMVAHYLNLHLPRKVELLSKFSGDLRPIYADKLAALDSDLGRLFGALKARGDWDRTIIVITADHGEEMNERGYSEHAFHLYDTVLGVPLFTHVPGHACLPVQTPATLVDVVPMLADALGLQIRSAVMQGHWPPQQSEPIYAFSTVGGPFMSIIDGNQKVIVDARYGDTEVYDLLADPAEKHDLGGDLSPAIIARLARGPIPWNPLLPLAQRYRRASGNEYDVCPAPAARSSRQATVQATPAAAAPASARLQ